MIDQLEKSIGKRKDDHGAFSWGMMCYALLVTEQLPLLYDFAYKRNI